MTKLSPVTQGDLVLERISLGAAARRLQGILAYKFQSNPEFGVLVAGPHPLLGGDLQNNLVLSLMDALANAGGLALTFQYSGLGSQDRKSDGLPESLSVFWNTGRTQEEENWIEETSAAMRLLRQMISTPRVAVGYSFGCYACCVALAEDDLAARILISPNPSKHGIPKRIRPSQPVLVIAAENDFACPTADLETWFHELIEPKQLIIRARGEHFFRGQEPEVSQAVVDYLKAHRLIRGLECEHA